jgi:hypothetical protein
MTYLTNYEDRQYEGRKTTFGRCQSNNKLSLNNVNFLLLKNKGVGL